MVSCRFVVHAIVTKGMKWQFCTGTRGMREALCVTRVHDVWMQMACLLCER